MVTVVVAVHDNAILADGVIIGPGQDAEPDSRSAAEDESVEGADAAMPSQFLLRAGVCDMTANLRSEAVHQDVDLLVCGHVVLRSLCSGSCSDLCNNVLIQSSIF